MSDRYLPRFGPENDYFSYRPNTDSFASPVTGYGRERSTSPKLWERRGSTSSYVPPSTSYRPTDLTSSPSLSCRISTPYSSFTRPSSPPLSCTRTPPSFYPDRHLPTPAALRTSTRSPPWTRAAYPGDKIDMFARPTGLPSLEREKPSLPPLFKSERAAYPDSGALSPRYGDLSRGGSSYGRARSRSPVRYDGGSRYSGTGSGADYGSFRSRSPGPYGDSSSRYGSSSFGGVDSKSSYGGGYSRYGGSRYGQSGSSKYDY